MSPRARACVCSFVCAHASGAFTAPRPRPLQEWLCSGWNQPAAQAGFERTMDAVAEALEASGVGGRFVPPSCPPAR